MVIDLVDPAGSSITHQHAGSQQEQPSMGLEDDEQMLPKVRTSTVHKLGDAEPQPDSMRPGVKPGRYPVKVGRPR